MNLPATESPPIFFVEPESHSEVMCALQKLKERNTVLLNLAKLKTPRAKQTAADMMAGCSCAIGGKATWIAKDTYLYTPNNVDVNLKLRLIEK